MVDLVNGAPIDAAEYTLRRTTSFDRFVPLNSVDGPLSRIYSTKPYGDRRLYVMFIPVHSGLVKLRSVRINLLDESKFDHRFDLF